jgi:hypothetical protein
MPDITFIVSKRVGKLAEGTLSWAAKGLSSRAASGPYGNGALPAGTYRAQRKKMLDKKPSDEHGAYCDGQRKCWMQPMDAEPANGRTELGIHPDGNVAGTEGCIGLKDKDTKVWYDAFHGVGQGSSTTIEVKG